MAMVTSIVLGIERAIKITSRQRQKVSPCSQNWMFVEPCESKEGLDGISHVSALPARAATFGTP